MIIISDCKKDIVIPAGLGDNAGVVYETAGVESLNGQKGELTLKTINGEDVLGEGDIQIKGGVESVNGQTGNVSIDVPAKVSELQNDAGYQTKNEVNDAIQSAMTGMSDDKVIVLDNKTQEELKAIYDKLDTSAPPKEVFKYNGATSFYTYWGGGNHLKIFFLNCEYEGGKVKQWSLDPYGGLNEEGIGMNYPNFLFINVGSHIDAYSNFECSYTGSFYEFMRRPYTQPNGYFIVLNKGIAGSSKRMILPLRVHWDKEYDGAEDIPIRIEFDVEDTTYVYSNDKSLGDNIWKYETERSKPKYLSDLYCDPMIGTLSTQAHLNGNEEDSKVAFEVKGGGNNKYDIFDNSLSYGYCLTLYLVQGIDSNANPIMLPCKAYTDNNEKIIEFDVNGFVYKYIFSKETNENYTGSFKSKEPLKQDISSINGFNGVSVVMGDAHLDENDKAKPLGFRSMAGYDTLMSGNNDGSIGMLSLTTTDGQMHKLPITITCRKENEPQSVASFSFELDGYKYVYTQDNADDISVYSFTSKTPISGGSSASAKTYIFFNVDVRDEANKNEHNIEVFKEFEKVVEEGGDFNNFYIASGNADDVQMPYYTINTIIGKGTDFGSEKSYTVWALVRNGDNAVMAEFSINSFGGVVPFGNPSLGGRYLSGGNIWVQNENNYDYIENSPTYYNDCDSLLISPTSVGERNGVMSITFRHNIGNYTGGANIPVNTMGDGTTNYLQFIVDDKQYTYKRDMSKDNPYWNLERTLNIGGGETSLNDAGNAIQPVYISGGTAIACDMARGDGGKNFGCLPYIKEDGVMEVGKYIDFHTDATSGQTSTDYQCRIKAHSNCLGIITNGTESVNLEASENYICQSKDICNIKVLTQAEYDDLGTKDANTLYCIKG